MVVGKKELIQPYPTQDEKNQRHQLEAKIDEALVRQYEYKGSVAIDVPRGTSLRVLEDLRETYTKAGWSVSLHFSKYEKTLTFS